MIRKAGERVYIRKDLKTGDGDGDWNFEGDMVNYLGRIATITEVEDFGCYSLDIDNGRFGWIDCMFDEGEEILPKHQQKYDKLLTGDTNGKKS